MEEKVYRSMGVIGACNLAVGIILIVVGVACGFFLLSEEHGYSKIRRC